MAAACPPAPSAEAAWQEVIRQDVDLDNPHGRPQAGAVSACVIHHTCWGPIPIGMQDGYPEVNALDAYRSLVRSRLYTERRRSRSGTSSVKMQ